MTKQLEVFEQCEDDIIVGSNRITLYCVKNKGHDGLHESMDGFVWGMKEEKE